MGREHAGKAPTSRRRYAQRRFGGVGTDLDVRRHPLARDLLLDAADSITDGPHRPVAKTLLAARSAGARWARQGPVVLEVPMRARPPRRQPAALGAVLAANDALGSGSDLQPRSVDHLGMPVRLGFSVRYGVFTRSTTLTGMEKAATPSSSPPRLPPASIR